MPAIYDNLYCLKRRFCLPIVQNTRELAPADLIKALLLERLRFRGICRVAGVSQMWLLDFIGRSGNFLNGPQDIVVLERG